MPKKSKLTVYLAKTGKGPRDVIVGLKPERDGHRGRQRHAPDSTEIPGIGTLYYRQVHPHSPAWAEDFFSGTIEDGLFSASSPSAALLVEVRDRLFAVTFGQGRYLLDMDAMEDRFGLRVVLNSGEELSFRKVDSTSVAGNAGKTSEQLPRLSKLDDFTIDSVTDTLDKVTAKVSEDSIFSGTVSGGPALSFTTDRDVTTIISLLEEVLSRYESESYKSWYPWVDNVRPVKDYATISALESKTIELINDHSEAIWTAPPELIEWDCVKGFKIEGRGQKLFDDILMADVLGSFRNGLNTFEQLRSKRVRAIDSRDGESELYSWSVASCLYGEFQLDGSSYCVNAGKWYQVAKDYADKVNAEYNRALEHDVSSYPLYKTGEHEGPYNERLAATSDSFLLMDAKPISHGAPHSSVELCDVLDGNNTFIHVKHYSGSATLSHLFLQGYNSAYLIKGDQAFVDNANKKIAKQNKGKGHELEAGRVELVIFAIICEKVTCPPNIPFFSRISYNEVARRLKAMGVESRICAIPEVA